jgi:Na+/melibiose symporter-like transporter
MWTWWVSRFALSLSTLALGAFGGYESGYCKECQPKEVEETLRMIQGPVCGSMVALSLFFAFFYPLTAAQSLKNKLALQRMRETAKANARPETSVKTNSYAPQDDLLGGTTL